MSHGFVLAAAVTAASSKSRPAREQTSGRLRGCACAWLGCVRVYMALVCEWQEYYVRIRARNANGEGEWGYIMVRPMDRSATPARAAARLANASDFAHYPPALAAGAAPIFSPSIPLLELRRAATLSVLGRGSELAWGSCCERAHLCFLL